MGSSLAVSAPLLGIAFVAGIIIGWMLANVTRTTETIQLSAIPPGTDLSTGARRVAKTKVRTMELKCKCGSVLKFRDPVEPGYQPYPSGDSFSCSGCGKVYDLREIRKLEKGAQTY
ncbi:MAG: hypothetical protein WCA22_00085 [Candidatus Binatus sp.]